MVLPGKFGKITAGVTAAIIIILGMLTIWSIARQSALIEFSTDMRLQAAVKEHKVDELNLEAQRESVLWAKWMFWATIYSIALSGGALFGLWRSIGLTREAISDNRRLGEAQSRAYVHAASAHHANTDKGYGLLINLINVGETPAAIFEIGARIRKVQHGNIENSLAERPAFQMKSWTALGPGLPPLDVRLDIEKAVDIINEFSRPIDGYVFLVDGTISYRDVYGQWFETDFAFWSYTTQTGKVTGNNKLRRPTSRIRAYQAVEKPTRRNPSSA